MLMETTRICHRENSVLKIKSWMYWRPATFLVVGLMNTAFIRAEDAGTWKNYLGCLLLLLALIDLSVIVYKLAAKRRCGR